jgi:hypothetical protein
MTGGAVEEDLAIIEPAHGCALDGPDAPPLRPALAVDQRAAPVSPAASVSSPDPRVRA